MGVGRKFRVAEEWYVWRGMGGGVLRQAYHPRGGGV
nr:MAG TPA: hypothetical protein [Caudoviricetes sp.]